MRLTKIQQLLDYQKDHDKKYHSDIYYQSTLFKLKHFTLHFSKYFARLVLDVEEVNTKNIVDTLIITLSMINSLNAPVQEFNLNGANNDIHIKESYAKVLENLAKSVDSLDHIESYPTKDTLIKCCQQLLDIVEQYIYMHSLTNFELILIDRYRQIRDTRLQ